MIYAAGIDVGSTQTKGIIINDKLEILSRALTDTGAYVTRAAERCFLEALQTAGIEREKVGYVVGTGYGRYKLFSATRRLPRLVAMRAAPAISFPTLAPSSTWAGKTPRG